MKLTLVEKRQEAKGTYSFFWKPDKSINYEPGQYFYFTLPKLVQEDSKGSTRHFTLSSSPTEGELIRFTTRIREGSGFKQTLATLEKGTEIQGEGPEGTFILDENEKGDHVLLAGGIGITPFRCFIKYAIDKKTNAYLHLIYSNSHTEEIVFYDELKKLANENDNIKVDFTVSKPEESKEKWSGLTGRIDEQLIKKLVTDIENKKYWLCGPPPMVDAMEDLLSDLQVSHRNINTEKFTGY